MSGSFPNNIDKELISPMADLNSEVATLRARLDNLDRLVEKEMPRIEQRLDDTLHATSDLVQSVKYLSEDIKGIQTQMIDNTKFINMGKGVLIFLGASAATLWAVLSGILKIKGG